MPWRREGAPISPFNMVFAEKTISDTYYGSVRPDIDFPILADLDMEKKLNLDDLISRHRRKRLHRRCFKQSALLEWWRPDCLAGHVGIGESAREL